ncbi:uroporphyrinogen decarboxylase family protein [bacterium]|nr:uroporphyrinogen decarboxylase family protein [bacterium]
MSMSPKERVLRSIRCEETDRIPWVPFVGCHAAHLLGLSASEYLKSAELMAAGVQAAVERYKPDGIPTNFDLQLEAEALGCGLVWAGENPPSVSTHPLEDGRQLADLAVPGKADGRIGVVLDATRRIRQANPELAVYGILTGPFTLALHLKGTGIFMSMFDDPQGVHELMAFCQRVAEAMASWFIETGCDIVAVVDPMTSQIGPDQFREFVTPYVAPLFDSIRSQGRLGSFFVCGHAQQNIEAMCECRPDNISIDENIPLDYVRDICLPRGISFGGNMQLTTVLLLGTETDAQRNALACIETGGARGFILAPGCDLPYNTPPANLEAVGRLVADPYQQEVIRALGDDGAVCATLDMSEYGQADRVIVDIITLDSEACAPCQYMVEAVRAVAPEFEGIVKWREHKIKYRDSLVFMTSLMVKNVPTICIDGQITFVSRIPRREEMVAAIQRRILEKLRTKIQRRRATLFILGDDSEKTAEVRGNVDKAIRELGAEVEVRLLTKDEDFYAFGLSPVQKPAVVLARYTVKSARQAPEVCAVREWIKETL